MPYKKVSLGNGKFKVVNSQTGKVHAASTTEDKANDQIRLLYAKENNDDLDWNTPREKATKILAKRRV